MPIPMGLLFKLKKYFCCSIDEETRTDVSIVLIGEDDTKQTTSCATVPIYYHPVTLEDVNESELHPLSSAEVLNNIDDEDTSSSSTSMLYSIAMLPPATSSKPTLVLDLDNTLVYASLKKLKIFDHKITVTHSGKTQDVWIVERPGLAAFLDQVATKYELVLFTAGIKQYGLKVLRLIDRNMNISYFLDRRFCTIIGKNNKNQDFFAKDIRILGRDLSKILIVDDRAYSFCFDVYNGILVPVFNGDPDDRCLESLRRYLDECSTLEDMRARKPFKYKPVSIDL